MGQNSATANTKIKNQPPPATQNSKSMFYFTRIIGKGGFGRVWKVTEKKTKKVYAMKVIDKARVITKKSVDSILKERQILSRLLEGNCEFIVNMKCSFQDRQNLYLLMDYLDGGDLRYYINRKYDFSETQIKFLVRCLAQGLNHLHERNFIHRDIKPENIILEKTGYARITDLGISKQWRPENSHETSGTPGYMAPQVMLRQNHSFCADFFAVGVIAYELLVGRRPYVGKDRKQIREQMLAKEAKIPQGYLGKISKQGADFINKLLQRVARKRLGYNGISQILTHPWLNLKSVDRFRFLQKKVSSPITPMEIVFNQAMQRETEPDALTKQNMLLLKRADVQAMFQNYNFMPSKDSNLAKRQQYITTTDMAGTMATSFS